MRPQSQYQKAVKHPGTQHASYRTCSPDNSEYSRCDPAPPRHQCCSQTTLSLAQQHDQEKDAGTYRRDQTPIPLPVPAALPVHRPTQPLLPDQLRLHLHHLRRVIADHQPRRVVVAPTRTNAPIILNTLTLDRKGLVVIHAHLPTPLSLALIGGSRAVGISKAAPV